MIFLHQTPPMDTESTASSLSDHTKSTSDKSYNPDEDEGDESDADADLEQSEEPEPRGPLHKECKFIVFIYSLMALLSWCHCPRCGCQIPPTPPNKLVSLLTLSQTYTVGLHVHFAVLALLSSQALSLLPCSNSIHAQLALAHRDCNHTCKWIGIGLIVLHPVDWSWWEGATTMWHVHGTTLQQPSVLSLVCAVHWSWALYRQENSCW